MSKYTKELDAVTERINGALKANGYKIEIGHRNNYTAIDLCSLNSGRNLGNVEAGLTDKEAISYLRAMLKGVDLITNVCTK